MLNLDSRQKELLILLLRSKEPLSLSQLQEELHASRRTIYYLVNKLNETLQILSAGAVNNKRGKGYYLSEKQKNILSAEMKREEESVFLRPKERIYYLICWLMYPKIAIHVETITEVLDISRNSVFNALKQVKKELERYDLQLGYTNRKGYFINGKALNGRAVLLYYLRLLLCKIHYRKLHFLSPSEVELFYSRLMKISAEMKNEYHQDNLLSIACLLSIVHHVKQEFDFSLLELKDLGETDELRLIDAYFQDLNVHERLYLAVHLLGSKAGAALRVQDDENDIVLFELASRIVGVFERRACAYLTEKVSLINSLYMHFKLSMYYYRLSIQAVNPMIKEVKSSYNDLYQLVKMVCEEMQQEFPFPLTESEITYITVHFGGHIHQKGGRFYRNIRVLVVCPSGISTSTLLKREIEDLYSNVTVVAATTVNNLAEYKEKVDFIVSTIDIQSDLPWIRVHAILSKEDRSRIASLMMLNFETYKVGEREMDGLFAVLEKYVEKGKTEQMRRDVYDYLRKGNVIVNVQEQRQLRIFDVLKEEDILIKDKEMLWEEAISLAASPLLKKNIIRRSYVTAMIDLLHDYGPYIVLQNKVAIAHASPSQGANLLGLSLLICPGGIEFDQEVEVKFLFVLSNPNQDKQLHLLRDIMELSSEPSTLKEIESVSDKRKILEKLNMISSTAKKEE